MKNFIQPGKTITVSNSGSAISSGGVLSLSTRIVVACEDIGASSSGEALWSGVVELAKVTGTAFAIGDRLFWDVSNAYLTKTAAGNIPAGTCTEAAGSSVALAKVKLCEVSPYGIAAVQADTTAADLAALKVDFNALLAKLKASGQMASS